jgi:hypothetical protein
MKEPPSQKIIKDPFGRTSPVRITIAIGLQSGVQPPRRFQTAIEAWGGRQRTRPTEWGDPLKEILRPGGHQTYLTFPWEMEEDLTEI